MKAYLKYKPSNIEWIGEIPEHWDVRKVSRSFNTIGSGTTPNTNHPEYYENGTINWVITGDLNENILNETYKKISDLAFKEHSTLKIYPKGTLLIALYGATIGKVSILGIEACTNQACCALANSPFFKIKFIFYWFLANKQNIIQLGYGGGQPNISQELIRYLRIPCTSPEEQLIIIRFLDDRTQKIDTLIEKKQKLIDLLREELTATINQAVTKGLNPDVPMKDSGIDWMGEVPKHWEVRRLKYVATLKSGDFINAENINPVGNFPVLGGNGLRGYTNTFTHEGNYILIGRQGALCGNINLVAGKFYATEHAVVVTILDKSETIWLAELLRAMNLNQYSQASAQPGLAIETIKNLFIPSPSYKEQKEIKSLINSENERIKSTILKIEKEIALLQEYRTALISEVVTGKIDVREAI